MTALFSIAYAHLHDAHGNAIPVYVSHVTAVVRLGANAAYYQPQPTYATQKSYSTLPQQQFSLHPNKSRTAIEHNPSIYQNNRRIFTGNNDQANTICLTILLTAVNSSIQFITTPNTLHIHMHTKQSQFYQLYTFHHIHQQVLINHIIQLTLKMLMLNHRIIHRARHNQFFCHTTLTTQANRSDQMTFILGRLEFGNRLLWI